MARRLKFAAVALLLCASACVRQDRLVISGPKDRMERFLAAHDLPDENVMIQMRPRGERQEVVVTRWSFGGGSGELTELAKAAAESKLQFEYRGARVGSPQD